MTTMLAVKLIAEEIGIGTGVGISLTLFAAWLLNKCHDQGWVNETWEQVPVVALAFGCFTLAQMLGGSGFITSFVGGLLFGEISRHHKHPYLLAAEGTGDTLALTTWVIFGAAVPPQSLHLVLVGRKDPFLPISSFRATDQVTEVRTHDLRFTDSEAHTFLNAALGDQIHEAMGTTLAKRTEDWVTGLRFAVLAMRENILNLKQAFLR